MWTILSLMIACVAVALGGWIWAKESHASVLGKTDYTGTLNQLARCAKNGSTLRLSSSEKEAAVCIAKVKGQANTAVFTIEFAPPLPNAKLEELRRHLGVLDIDAVPAEPAASDGQAVFLRLSNLRSSQAGRVVDLALFATGLERGHHYIHEFEGEMDSEAELEYIRDLNVRALDLSESRLQRGLFKAILRLLGQKSRR